MLERLLRFYDQLPTATRQPYGRFINVARIEGADAAISQVRDWMARCKAAATNGNALMQCDLAKAGCLLNILTGADSGRNN